MSYDIEDCIDNFMKCVGEADNNKVGILQKASVMTRPGITAKIYSAR